MAHIKLTLADGRSIYLDRKAIISFVPNPDRTKRGSVILTDPRGIGQGIAVRESAKTVAKILAPAEKPDGAVA